MSLFSEILLRLCEIVFLLISWLIHSAYFLATCFLEHPKPELPVTISGSLPITNALEVSRTKDATEGYIDCGPPRKLNLLQNRSEFDVDIKERPQKRVIHAKRSKPHNLCHGRGQDYQELATNVTTDSCMESPTLSIYYTPTLSYPSPLISPNLTPIITPVPIVDDFLDPCAKHVPPVRHSEIEIGELGKRRGFKGRPLFTSATGLTSSLLSLPSGFSPRSVDPCVTSEKSINPRSPLDAVTNIARTTSTKSTKLDISQDLQELYDETDPFSTFGDSFFVPDVSFGNIPPANLNNLSPYCPYVRTHKRSRSLKRKSNLNNLRSIKFHSIKIFSMKTMIYDMSTSDVSSDKVVSRSRNTKVPEGHLVPTSCHSPMIVLTLPSAPSSPTKRSSVPADGVKLPSVHKSPPVDTEEPSKSIIQAIEIMKEDQSPRFVSESLSQSLIPTVNLDDFNAYNDQSKWPLQPRERSVFHNICNMSLTRHENPTLDIEGIIEGKNPVSHITKNTYTFHMARDQPLLSSTKLLSGSQRKENEGGQHLISDSFSYPVFVALCHDSATSHRPPTPQRSSESFDLWRAPLSHSLNGTSIETHGLGCGDPRLDKKISQSISFGTITKEGSEMKDDPSSLLRRLTLVDGINPLASTTAPIAPKRDPALRTLILPTRLVSRTIFRPVRTGTGIPAMHIVPKLLDAADRPTARL